jgi:hypothetical protein
MDRRRTFERNDNPKERKKSGHLSERKTTQKSEI